MNMLNIIRNTDNSLIKRMNAQGLTFAAIEAAIVKCGNALRTNGWVKPPKELANMASEAIIQAVYQHHRSAKIDGSYAFGPLIRWPADRIAEFIHQIERIPDGTQIECYLQDEIHLVLVEKKGHLLKVVAEYDHQAWEAENTGSFYLPPGIRAAVAAQIGVDINSTFHDAFDAIVDSQYY